MATGLLLVAVGTFAEAFPGRFDQVRPWLVNHLNRARRAYLLAKGRITRTPPRRGIVFFSVLGLPPPEDDPLRAIESARRDFSAALVRQREDAEQAYRGVRVAGAVVIVVGTGLLTWASFLQSLGAL